MAYDDSGKALREDWYVLSNTFGATGVAYNHIGPKGAVGFVRDIVVDITTNLGGTLVPEICIGISSGDATYGRFRLGSTASTSYTTGIQRASQVSTVTGNPPRVSPASDFTGHVILDGGTAASLAGRIKADTAFVITALAGTGSGAGGGHVRVTFDWMGHNVQ